MMTENPDTQHHDTQWPRWEVFKQDNEKRPYQAVGTVHAGDPQHALLTARNVFVRRPAAISLWAVREDELLTATLEQVSNGTAPFEQASGVFAAAGTYHVGIKSNNKRSMTFVDLVGTVQAQHAGDALRQAHEQYPQALAWMVFHDAQVARTEQSSETVESWFEPAKEKTYKQQQFYGVVGRHISEYKPSAKATAPSQAQAPQSGQATEARLPPTHPDARESKEGLA